jgi:hypothetical protein
MCNAESDSRPSTELLTGYSKYVKEFLMSLSEIEQHGNLLNGILALTP